MASSAAVQTLVAAFFFGILLQAASGVLLIQVKSNDGSIREDGRRLALALFLCFAVLWALVDFINLNITSSTSSCQAALVISTLADQLGRVSVEQFLLWSIGHGSFPTLRQLILQFTLVARFVAGAVLVGFTRPQFAPVCVARTSLLPIGIAVLALDAIIIIGLAICSMSISAPGRGQKRALVLIIVAFALWTGTSSPMLLSISTPMLIIKTTLPSVGLLILVAFVAIFAVSILSPQEGTVIPEATSPFVTQSPSMARGLVESSGRGSQMPGNRFETTSSPLFLNPPANPQALNSITTTVQGPYLENIRVPPTSSALDNRRLQPEEDRINSSMRMNGSNSQLPRRTSTSFFAGPEVTNGQGLISSQGGFAGSMERSLPTPTKVAPSPHQKKSRFKWSKQAPASSVRAIGISKPVMINDNDLAQPFAKIKTIDLTTAANNERERREDAANRVRLIPKRPAPPPPSGSIDAALRRSISVKRKEVLGHQSAAIKELPQHPFSSLLVGNASTTSASLSPGRENVRQRSPRGINPSQNVAPTNFSKPSLQRKPTIGLPSNPRAQKTMQTEDIVANPGEGNTYSSGSGSNSRETLPETAYATELKSSGSILHRPRPYRRDAEKDRAFFPSGVYPHHRRSKSGSPRTAHRKSIFESHPGSPTKLPYIPAPPPRPADLARILSDGNKSMTFHEKIQFLFPTPPLSTLSNSRRSSVPSIPRLPSVYMSDSSPLQSPTDDGQQSSRASKKSRIISFETEDIWESVALHSDADGGNSQREQSVKSSNMSDVEIFTSSEAMPVEFTKVKGQFHTEKMTAIPKMTVQNKQRRPREADVSGWYSSDDGRQSFLLDESQNLPGDKSPDPRSGSVWHRRIGDVLPTFSERRKSSKNRKMPPPTPLLLNWKGKNISVVVHSPAPSPVDSPGKAMKSLQAQLKRFEDPNRVSADSSPQIHPSKPRVVDSSEGHNSQTRLLQDLEDEMGIQETLWQKMQHNFDRDSNSVMLTPQPPTPKDDDLQKIPPPQPLSQQDRAHTRKSWRRSGASSSSVSSRESSNTKAAGWQQRLSEAQMEYLETVPNISRNRNVNFFTIAQSQVGSPTPPESVDSDTDIETGSESGLSDMEWQLPSVELRKDWLWKPQQARPEPTAHGLWDAAVAVSNRTTAMDAPAKHLRPGQRIVQEPLLIYSSALWSKPISSSTGTFIGLWGSRKVRPKSITIRRTSRRSQRKSKRVGYLPDIVESPQPLPHKRDTLGIFQFPSGETSDCAVYHSAFSPTLFSTLKLNSVPQAKTPKPGPDPIEYPSSFFDDYDEQDDSEDLDSDDDFDESTLWEISNLLYSKDVSSMDYFHPLAETENDLVEYEDGVRFDMEPEAQDIIIGMAAEPHDLIHDPIFELPIRPLALTSNTHSKLWASTTVPDTRSNSHGLPQPDSTTWQFYVSSSQSSSRAKFRQPQTLPVLTTSSLWALPPLEKPVKVDTAMWAPRPVLEEAIQPGTHASGTASDFLWSPVVVKPANIPLVADTLSLWASSKAVTTSTDIPFATEGDSTFKPHSLSFENARKARKYDAPLAKLVSHQLWTGQKVLNAEHHWISESSIRPESPSVRSDSSSGGSSPTSDTLSAKSSSTKASSIWGSLKSVQVSLSWNAKPQKVAILPASTETKESSGSPISPREQRPLPAKRDSRVLAYREMFESRASESAGTHARVPTSHKTSAVTVVSRSSNKDRGHIQADLEAEQLCQYLNSMVEENLNKDLGQATNPSSTHDIPYDVATRHPVFFTHNLLSSAVDIHPAAIGYTTNPSITKDAFPSNKVSSQAPATDDCTQPSASTGAESAANHKFLWSKSLVLQSSNKWEELSQIAETELEMWSSSPKMDGLTNTSQNTTSYVGIEHMGKPTAYRKLPLPVISSSRLFEPRISVLEPPVHWLHSTSRIPEAPARSWTWEPPLSAPILDCENAGMWIAPIATAPPSPSLFSNPHTAPWDRKKRVSVSTKDIVSSELWTRPAEFPDKPKHWLVDRRASRVQFRY